MKKVSVADLKNNLSRYLAYVRRGGRIVVYRRDEPVAELTSVDRQRHGVEAARLRGLERQGIVRMGSGSLPEALRTPPDGRPSGVLDALLRERKTGR